VKAKNPKLAHLHPEKSVIASGCCGLEIAGCRQLQVGGNDPEHKVIASYERLQQAGAPVRRA
jgi:hypothetical protein